jgi:nitroreductase
VDLLEGIATTRAIRRIKPDPIPDDDLAQLMFAATRAPTGSNRQPFRFLVLRDGPKANQAKVLLGEAFRRGWNSKRTERSYDSPAAERQARAMQYFVDNFEQVPVVVLACLVRYRQPVPTEGGSVYPACQNLLLAARALGYGGVLTQWHAFVEQPLRELLGIPEGVAIHATIPLGKPMGRHGPVRRRPLQELVYDDGWEEIASWATEPRRTT